MKVLHIINSLAMGGAEKLVSETLPLFNKAGYQVDLLLLNGTTHPFLEKLMGERCCKIITFGNKSIFNPWHINRIRSHMKEYDLIHVHLFPAQYFVSIANWLNGNKNILVFTEHSTGNRRMANKFLAKIDRIFYRNYSKVIAISEAVKNSLSQHLQKSNKISVIMNGVNISKIENALPNLDFEKKYNIEDRILLVQVAGFRVEKDQDTVIKALCSLPESYHLILIGDGVRRNELETLVLQYSLQKRVHFLGFREDIYSILKSCSLMIISSHWEGFGLAAVEGMAANKPVLASDVKGLSEVVGGAGILFDRGDEVKLAQHIVELNSDSNYYSQVATNCFNRSKNFDINLMVDKHIELYKELHED